MDTRTAMLKTLKKEAKHERRKYYSLWKGLAVVMLLVVLFAVLVGAAEELQNQEPVSRILAYICDWKTQAETALGVELNLSPVESVLEHGLFIPICQAVAAAGFVLFLLFAVLWNHGKGKWKYSGAYLDYRTMYVTLKAERQAAREK
ncbi:MAG: hypothetical protein IJB47_02865 [Oscillospiraceae bacterium]|nr:hypothetical protein [Oscillospiraceae bacterium]